MNIEIANRLVQLRKAHGYSQESLAAELGISRQAVSKWERGESSPELENIVELSRIYGITLDALIKGETEKAEPAEEELPVETADAPVYFCGEEEDDGEEEVREDSVNIKMHLQWENDSKGPWSKFPFFLVVLVVYLAGGFLMGLWLEGAVLFLLGPVYYSIAAWLDGDRKESFLSAVPYPIVTTVVYLAIGLFFGMWHPTWLIFLTIPIYGTLVSIYEKQREKQR